MFTENNIPVFLVTLSTQEISCWRNVKTGEVIAGNEDVVQKCRYAMSLTRVPEDVGDELTGGWKVQEVSFVFAGCGTGPQSGLAMVVLG
jgi:import inner membrane translocase subunit TIM44